MRECILYRAAARGIRPNPQQRNDRIFAVKKVEVGGFAPPSEHPHHPGPTGLSALNTYSVSVRRQRGKLFRMVLFTRGRNAPCAKHFTS